MASAVSFAFRILIVAMLGPAVCGADAQFISPDIESEARALGGENLVRLVRYRAEVEAGAYLETLNLCASYPSGDNLLGARPPQLAWVRIFSHGVLQPLSILSGFGRQGLKSTYNEVTQSKIWQIDSWFRSVHTIYLLHSPGFKRAARECLHTEDSGKIARFGYAVTGADMLGSMVSMEALSVPISYAFGKVSSTVGPVWGRMVSPKAARRAKHAAILTLGPYAAYKTVRYFWELRQARAAAESMLNNAPAERERMKLSGRRMVMAKAVTELRRALDANDLSQFETWAKRNVSAEDLKLARLDFESDEANAKGTADQQNYRIVLKAILPVLDQISLN